MWPVRLRSRRRRTARRHAERTHGLVVPTASALAAGSVQPPLGGRFADGVDLPLRSSRFELTGGSILNVVQHVCIAAITRGSGVIRPEHALRGIQREVEKEGKAFHNVLEHGLWPLTTSRPRIHTDNAHRRARSGA